MGKIIYSNAKINIGLNVIKKRNDGYHELEMTMLPINLYDEMKIEFNKIPGKLEIICNIKSIPTDEKNIIYKIYNMFFDKTGIKREKIKVDLVKYIPSEAGLGGGSSNGAFFLKELNNHYGNLLTLNEMIELTKNIGADIPFFLLNKASIIKGIGEKIEIFDNYHKFNLILIKPKFGVSTGVAYNSVTKLEKKEFADINEIIKGLENNNIDIIEKNIKNTLWQAINNIDKEIFKFHKKLTKITKRKFFMSGSGSCFYSFIKNNESELGIKQFLEENFEDCFICNTKLL